MQRLKQRADFLAASRSPYYWKRPPFILQCRVETGVGIPRFGFTVTKKQGNAVMRNRIKRRLREVARLHLQSIAWPECDYVLIGHRKAAELPFEELVQEVTTAMERLHHKIRKQQKVVAQAEKREC